MYFYFADLNPRNEFISTSFYENKFAISRSAPHDGLTWYTGIGFKVLHPVTLNNVGVHVRVVPSEGPLEVVLRDASSKTFSFEVTRQSCSSIADGFCFQKFTQNMSYLPRYYEAEIFIRRGSHEIEYHAPYLVSS